jgi:uncharacterized membrane protein
MRGLRLLVTTLLGFVFGIISMLIVSTGRAQMPAGISWTAMSLSIIFSRALLGFVIGMSASKINYMLHGIILGFVVSIPMALGSLAFRGFTALLLTLIMGVIYGFLIELIARMVVKEKQLAPESTGQ